MFVDLKPMLMLESGDSIRERVLGALVSGHQGLTLLGGGLEDAPGFSSALKNLADIRNVAECGSERVKARVTNSADVVLASLPTIFLNLAESRLQLCDRVADITTAQLDSTIVESEIIPASLALAQLVQMPFPSPPATLKFGTFATTANGEALQALELFCAAPDDYRTCLRRAVGTTGVTPTIAVLTGIYLGAYQGSWGVPLDWQEALELDGIWGPCEHLADDIVAVWSGALHPLKTRATVGAARSLQARPELKMPSWH